ncbi:flagellar hook-associated protein FlgK [Clostridium bornimense]|uniref:Flagellar hook-associated protein 1 n=1 Tax=Clostridium bornimense TaxID=1216932 RepID=W6SGJ8_9CLOT|nr:flagellar hook-associated protein FlgK [Clostridium bornimense]CDM68840.1 flagellar hook-associated protein FlgK [Clostridium bornimense]
MLGLMSTLNTAKSGINATQVNINVTSHNISNANTEGYSRQVAKLVTTTPFSAPSFSSMAGPGQFGTGVEVASVTRVRNHFLDYQVRNETSKQGEYEIKYETLSKVEGILNEPSDSGLTSIMSDFFKAWQDVSNSPADSNARTVLAQKTDALTGALNSYYNQLTKMQEDACESIKQTVYDVNSLLSQIDTINQEIIQVSVAGQSPNDLMDRRDLLLDQLSAKMNINVDRNQNFNGENVSPVDSNGVIDPTLIKSVFNQEIKSFSYVANIDKTGTANADGTYTYEVTYYTHGDMTSNTNARTIKVNMTEAEAKELSQTRVLWADKNGEAIKNGCETISENEVVDFSELNIFKPSSGELKGHQDVQEQLDEYITQINNVAKAMALAVNAVHSASADGSTDTMPFFVNSDVAKYNEDGTLKNLDEVLAAEKDITAGNISINKEILNDVMKINAGKDETSGEGDGKRALAIAQIMDTMMMIQNMSSSTTREEFVGTLEENEYGVLTIASDKKGMKVESYYKDIINKLGVQTQEANRVVTNQTALLSDFENQRLQVSGVSLDEEMVNLIQFQHAYGANAKIISTVDELLDVLINGLKK